MNTKTIAKMTLTLAALATFLSTTAHADDAAALWNKTCASCHGKDGRGDTKMGKKVGVKDYTDAKVQGDLTDEKAVKAIKEGVKGDEGKQLMKAYGDAYTDDEIKGLVAYIRAFKAK